MDLTTVLVLALGLSMDAVAGWLAGQGFRAWIARIDHWIAFALLVFIGGRMIRESRRQGECRPAAGPMGWATMLSLALATSIDALAVGLSLSALSVSIWLPVALIGLVTFLLSMLAALVGRRFSARLAARASLLGGMILVGIGVRILAQHLGAG